LGIFGSSGHVQQWSPHCTLLVEVSEWIRVLASDGIVEACNNCPGASSQDQTDGDGEGVGDACDNGPDVDNREQAVSDGDGVADPCAA